MARKRELEAQSKRKARKILNPTSYAIQVDNFITYCMAKNLKQSTIDSYVFYLTYLKSFLMSKSHTLLVDDITHINMKDFFDFMRSRKSKSTKEHIQQSTINSAIASLRPFFNYLVAEGIIIENPMAKISKGKVDKKPIIPFLENEIAILLKQPDKSTYVGFRDYCIMLVLLSTGIRISECLSLKIQDINFKENKIIITETKNRNPRIVGLASKLKPELQRFIKICHIDSSTTDFLFQSQDGTQLRPRSIQQNIKNYGEEAKISNKRVSPHTFRHTYSIHYLKNGGSTASLREQLGHLTISTVEKYLYWSTDDKLEQFQKYNPLDNMNI